MSHADQLEERLNRLPVSTEMLQAISHIAHEYAEGAAFSFGQRAQSRDEAEGYPLAMAEVVMNTQGKLAPALEDAVQYALYGISSDLTRMSKGESFLSNVSMPGQIKDIAHAFEAGSAAHDYARERFNKIPGGSSELTELLMQAYADIGKELVEHAQNMVKNRTQPRGV